MTCSGLCSSGHTGLSVQVVSVSSRCFAAWRAFVPEVAVETVSLRPGTQRFDVTEALEELRRFSLVDQIFSNKEEDAFVGVPLAAAMYGQSKLEVSPFKVAVEEDRKILMEFGAGKQEDVERGVLPRIENLVRAVAIRASSNLETLEERLPVPLPVESGPGRRGPRTQRGCSAVDVRHGQPG